jgi:hypothetical protein
MSTAQMRRPVRDTSDVNGLAVKTDHFCVREAAQIDAREQFRRRNVEMALVPLDLSTMSLLTHDTLAVRSNAQLPRTQVFSQDSAFPKQKDQ